MSDKLPRQDLDTICLTIPANMLVELVPKGIFEATKKLYSILNIAGVTTSTYKVIGNSAVAAADGDAVVRA